MNVNRGTELVRSCRSSKVPCDQNPTPMQGSGLSNDRGRLARASQKMWGSSSCLACVFFLVMQLCLDPSSDQSTTTSTITVMQPAKPESVHNPSKPPNVEPQGRTSQLTNILTEMDLSSLLNTPHKRTSSGAENLNVDQPVFKQARGDDSEEQNSSSSGSSSSSSSEDLDLQGPLDGVYIVSDTRSDYRGNMSDYSILGVFASKSDAKAFMNKERDGYDSDTIDELENGGDGWCYQGEDTYDSPGTLTCEMTFHKLIWPTPMTEVSSPSSKSSGDSTGNDGKKEGAGGVSIFGQRQFPVSR